MPSQDSFSRRHRYGSEPKEITIREDAPANLRYFVLQSAYDFHWQPLGILRVLCKLLRVVPRSNQEHDYQVRKEVEELFYGCAWYRVYDVIEEVHRGIVDADEYGSLDKAFLFTSGLNDFFSDEGIGWQLANGRIVTRGGEAFEAVVTRSGEAYPESRE